MNGDNVIDLATRLKHMEEQSEKAVPLPQYNLPNTALLMDPALQLDLLIGSAIDEFTNSVFEATHFHRMFTLLKYIFEGVCPMAETKTGFSGRQYPVESGIAKHSVYCWGMSIGRISVDGDVSKNFRPSYQIQLHVEDFGPDFKIDEGTICPESWMQFDIGEDDIMTTRLPRHFVKKMNSLVRINGGQGRLHGDGYLVVIPYGGTLALVVNLILENPIQLLPADQRSDAK